MQSEYLRSLSLSVAAWNTSIPFSNPIPRYCSDSGPSESILIYLDASWMGQQLRKLLMIQGLLELTYVSEADHSQKSELCPFVFRDVSLTTKYVLGARASQKWKAWKISTID